jgi:hypothetical protein
VDREAVIALISGSGHAIEDLGRDYSRVWDLLQKVVCSDFLHCLLKHPPQYYDEDNAELREDTINSFRARRIEERAHAELTSTGGPTQPSDRSSSSSDSSFKRLLRSPVRKDICYFFGRDPLDLIMTNPTRELYLDRLKMMNDEARAVVKIGSRTTSIQ